MIKETFIFWITAQLIVIGIVNIQIHNEIVSNTFDCDEDNKIYSKWDGAIFPLAFFLPDTRELLNYCKH